MLKSNLNPNEPPPMKQCKEHEMHISYISLIFSFIDKEKYF
jgi:hypothetical protein